MSDLIGIQVILRPGHPHAGRCGRIVGVQQLAGAEAVEIQMDGYLGKCFAYVGQWRKVRSL